MDGDTMTWGRYYWPIWAAVTFLSFLGPEIYALVTNWRNTLSDYVWNFESLKRGASFVTWTFPHYAFIVIFIVTAVWLIGHMGWGIWR